MANFTNKLTQVKIETNTKSRWKNAS